MVDIRPFRALLYDADKAGDVARLLAPPYDVIDDARRAELAMASPFNCVHAILPEGEGDARYRDGAVQFRKLVGEALRKDPRPSIYVYHQHFSVEGRTHTRKGFIALVRLTAFGDGPVLAHERTLAGPKEDRLKLMRACAAHLELVFGLFSDPANAWERIVEPAMTAPILACDFDGTRHELYRVDDEQACAALVEHLEDRKVYIADGHHRYETMCTYADERRAAGLAADFGMMFLSNLDDPGLVVLPTHRLVHSIGAMELTSVLQRATTWFDVRSEPLPANAAALRSRLQELGALAPVFGLAVPGGSQLHVLTLRSDFVPDSSPLAALPVALQRLDVVLLHELVLERLLGIDKTAQAQKLNLQYCKSTEDALAIARDANHDVQLVCFMNATPVAAVRAVCDSGEVMPQKSTFFVPKIPTGLAFFDLKD